jgi:hypothetical protein
MENNTGVRLGRGVGSLLVDERCGSLYEGRAMMNPQANTLLRHIRSSAMPI